jgi:hypothetical protein
MCLMQICFSVIFYLVNPSPLEWLAKESSSVPRTSVGWKVPCTSVGWKASKKLYNFYYVSNFSSVLVEAAIFVWSGKKELVNRNTMCLCKLEGGFSVVNICLKVRALHLQWLRRWELNRGKWSFFFAYWVSVCFHDTLESVLASQA